MSSSFASRVVSSLRCGVVAVDREGLVTLINEPAAQLLEVPVEGWKGRPCAEVLAHCPTFATVLLDALDRETLPDRAELEIEPCGTRKLLLGFSLSRLLTDDGEVEGSAIFFKDLTLVEEERERQALRNRLAALGEVAAQMAHELRNRLGGVRVFLGLARRRVAADPDCIGYLNRAERELLDANEKMTQMLDFVRPLKLELGNVPVEPLCRSAVEATLARFPEAEVDVVWDVDPGIPLVWADEGRLRDALANLTANAVEAMGLNGRIELRLRRVANDNPTALPEPPVPGLREWNGVAETRVRIEVSDNGPGMTPDVLSRIFQPFYTTKEEGSGLGVPAAQKIVVAHGGSLDVRSAPGEGTTFIILIPAVPEEKPHG
ncbi:MAG: PAS domain-containing protein [Deltaproteobacteria bacterium]|nr:PAS domain-containing protein [Deltaproteobacteria bacterium]